MAERRRALPERVRAAAEAAARRAARACAPARLADAYQMLGAAASTIPSLVKSMCGIWDKAHVVTMEVVADAAAFDDDDEDDDAHFEDVIVARGQGTSLLWMMVPGCVAVSKLSQLLAESPLLVTKRLPVESKLWQRALLAARARAPARPSLSRRGLPSIRRAADARRSLSLSSQVQPLWGLVDWTP